MEKQVVRTETAVRIRPLQALVLALVAILVTVTPLALLMLVTSPVPR